MAREDVSVVLVHGAWADGSSWAKVIVPLAAEGVRVLAAPLPLTSFAADMEAVERALERVSEPVVLVGHAYAGAVIAATRAGRMHARVRSHPVDHASILTAPGPVVDITREAIGEAISG